MMRKWKVSRNNNEYLKIKEHLIVLYKNRESGKRKYSFDKQNPDSSCEQTKILGVSKTHFEFSTPRFSRSGIYTNRIFPRRKYPETPLSG